MAQYRLSNPWSSDSLASIDRLRRSMNDLFEGGALTTRRAGAYPLVNLYETVEGYVLTAELPGVDAADIEVSIDRSRVTLRGERRIERPSDASLHRAERQAGQFRRTIDLPVEVDEEKILASHRHGVLTLHVPKAEAHRPRKISVQAG